MSKLDWIGRFDRLNREPAPYQSGQTSKPPWHRTSLGTGEPVENRLKLEKSAVSQFGAVKKLSFFFKKKNLKTATFQFGFFFQKKDKSEKCYGEMREGDDQIMERGIR